MTENHPHDHDDTRPTGDDRAEDHLVPGFAGPDAPRDAEPTPAAPPAGEPEVMASHQHRYDAGPGTEDTTRFDSSAFGPVLPPPAAPPTRERRGGRGVALLAAALLVGAVAGFGGAAAYDALDDDTTSGSTRSVAEGRSAVANSPDTPAADGSVEQVANSVLPSVVKISIAGSSGASGSGSGVIISESGEILTNEHVVAPAADGGRLTVSFDDGSTAPASVVGTDPLTDIAVIQVEGVDGLTPATLGQSGNLDVGEQVVAVGSPFGLEATVTSGIVSALNRPVSIQDVDQSDPEAVPQSTTYPAIQTDAAINPGNSGGPLLNMNGEVVGVNSSIRSSSSGIAGEQGGSIGLGFAIPIDEILPIVEQLRAGEEATHARLGVSVSDATSEDGLVSGASVETVEEGSAAAEAGIEEGDVVVRVGDHVISDSSSLVATIRGFRPGEQVEIVLNRGGDEETLTVELGSDGGEPAS